eukprot:16012147-Heterocapsa_arctica.AAC.1
MARVGEHAVFDIDLHRRWKHCFAEQELDDGSMVRLSAHAIRPMVDISTGCTVQVLDCDDGLEGLPADVAESQTFLRQSTFDPLAVDAHVGPRSLAEVDDASSLKLDPLMDLAFGSRVPEVDCCPLLVSSEKLVAGHTVLRDAGFLADVLDHLPLVVIVLAGWEAHQFVRPCGNLFFNFAALARVMHLKLVDALDVGREHLQVVVIQADLVCDGPFVEAPNARGARG